MSRWVNDYATPSVTRVDIKEKEENKSQYQAYLDELKGVREKLGMFLRDIEWPCVYDFLCKRYYVEGEPYVQWNRVIFQVCNLHPPTSDLPVRGSQSVFWRTLDGADQRIQKR